MDRGVGIRSKNARIRSKNTSKSGSQTWANGANSLGARLDLCATGIANRLRWEASLSRLLLKIIPDNTELANLEVTSSS